VQHRKGKRGRICLAQKAEVERQEKTALCLYTSVVNVHVKLFLKKKCATKLSLSLSLSFILTAHVYLLAKTFDFFPNGLLHPKSCFIEFRELQLTEK
jgi:hypothetical protein